MHLHHVAVLLLSTNLAFSSAAANPNTASLTYPQCALDCKHNLHTTCSTTDTSCLCADEQYQQALSTCTTANCSTREALTTKYLGSRACNIPITRRYPEADPGTIVPFALATVLFLVRMGAKTRGLGGGWGPDDYTLIGAYGLAVIGYAVHERMVHYGFGMNMWDIVPHDNITIANKYFYTFTLLYKAVISLAKISVCLFLLRIFQSPVFRTITYTMIAINSAIAVIWILADSLHCIPVHLAWDAWDMPRPGQGQGQSQGQCINFTASTFANGFVNIAVDTMMVSMPVYEVVQLNLSWKKRAGVVVMFAVGLVLTVIGIIRVVVFSHNDSSNDNLLYSMEPLNHWSVIECQIAIVCACLPASRAVVAHFFPSVVGAGSSEHTSSATPYTNSNHNRVFSQSGNRTVAFAAKRESFIQLKDVG